MTSSASERMARRRCSWKSAPKSEQASGETTFLGSATATAIECDVVTLWSVARDQRTLDVLGERQVDVTLDVNHDLQHASSDQVQSYRSDRNISCEFGDDDQDDEARKWLAHDARNDGERITYNGYPAQ